MVFRLTLVVMFACGHILAVDAKEQKENVDLRGTLQLDKAKEKMQFEGQATPAEAKQIKVGATAKISIDAFPGRSFEGKVVSVKKTASSVKDKPKPHKVVFSLKDPPKRAKAGLTGTAVIKPAK